MSDFDFDALSIEDKKMLETKQLGLQLAPTQASLLICGDTGVGKTSFAHFIHKKSRSAKLTVLDCRHCSSFDFNLTEGGTIIIEDLDCASPLVQQELMKIAARTDGARPRFISTTRRDLRSLIKQNQFRQDLFYKIAVVHLEIPKLTNRMSDFFSIANFILEVSQIMHGKSGLRFTDEAIARLTVWHWPGNIRELENVIERAVLLAVNENIDVEHIQFEVSEEHTGREIIPCLSLSEVEKRLILQTLELTAQNRTKAAQMLGISIRTLRNKLNEYRCEGVV